jgi:putative aldouronate transport system permease protein
MKWNLIVKNYRTNKWLFWMIAPIVVYLIIFSYIPMGGLLMAFQDYSLFKGILGSKWVGFDNFIAFFNGLYFTRTLTNTLILSGLDLLFSFTAPIVFALMLNEVKRLRYKRIIQTVSYMPHFISIIVVASLILEFTTSTGIIASIVSSLGGIGRSYISKPQYFRLIYIVSNIWQTIGFGSIIYLAALSGISEEQYEAARIDGAGRIRQLIHVTLPGIASTIIIMLIMRMGQIMNINFEKILLLYSPATYQTGDVIMTYVYRMGILGQKYGYSTAVGLFNSVIGLIMIILANALSKKYTETSMF